MRRRLHATIVGGALLVSLLALLYDFGRVIGSPERALLPYRVIHDVETRMFLIALVLGGATMLLVVWLAVSRSAAFTRTARPLQPDWKRLSFFVWIGAVSLILAMVVLMSVGSMAELNTPPPDAPEMTIHVTGKTFTWRFDVDHLDWTQYEQLHVPANTVIRVEIESLDVIHSLAIQDLGFKLDAIPGQTTRGWFMAEQPGTHQINCAELCGSGHSSMTAKLVVVPRQEYAQWVLDNGGTHPFNATGGGGD